MSIVIYGTENCSFCVKSKNICDLNGFKYEYIDLFSDKSLKEELEKKLGFTIKSVPVIFVDDRHVAKGFEGLRDYIFENLE